MNSRENANLDLSHIHMVVNPNKLHYYLKITNYDGDKTERLIAGFRNGFSIGYQGPQTRKSESRNIPFSPGVGDKFDMWEKIMKEVAEKRVARPFNEIPYENFIQSPIGLVPKSGGKTRLIFHLSYNFSDLEHDASLNHFMPKHLCSVSYNDLDFAVECCLQMSRDLTNRQDEGCQGHNQGHGDKMPVFMSKTDLRSAFRMLPVRQADWK